MEVCNMNNVHVLSQDFTLQGIIDSYESLIWRPAYSNIGDFELYLPATSKAVELLKRDRFLVRDSDITVDSDDIITYKKVMIIKNIQLVTDIENGDYLTVTGKELKYLLHQRIVWSQTNLSGTAEAGIRRLINENVINPTNALRKISNFTLAPAVGLTRTLEKQVTGAYLDETIVEICNVYDYGWDIYIQNNKFVFTLYEGVNRSYAQKVNPYVVFCDTFDNLYNTDYQLNSEVYANTYLIGGEGEGKERIYTSLDIAAEGLDRYEAFVDARDISQNKGTDEEIPLVTYRQLLAERGTEASKEHKVTEAFTGEVISTVTFKYGKDFFLGDVVTVINSYGINKNTRVTSVIESDDSNGTILVPEFRF